MTEDTVEPVRYDALATGYARHWGPVIRPAAIALLDRIEPRAGDRVLDVGTGTGALALELLRRWPEAEVTGLDPSEAMLELAGRAAEEGLGPDAGDRFRRVVGLAGELPFDDASFDLAISSFVLQLVPSRAAALREIRRVLRPGGRLAWVTWLEGGEPFAADEVVDRVLDEFGFEPPERDTRPGDLGSVAAAAAATRRAGFREVRAEAGTLRHAWTASSYADFIAEFDEQSTFDELEPDERRELEQRLEAELDRLAPAALTIRIPVVYVTGGVPGTGGAT